MEKRVIISNLQTGDFIEVLRNSSKEEYLKPIAFKNIGSEAIYNTDMERIDSKYLEFTKKIG